MDFWCEHAWLGGEEMTAGVVIGVEGERIVTVRTGVAEAPDGAEALRGYTLPGLANAHSHAFQRAFRGRTEAGRGTFWTWRERMYEAAARLDPDSYFALARATFGEMALAGVTAVGEFHYVHHAPDGTPYDDPNAMGEAVIAAAAEAGIRITLIDTCYLHGGIGEEIGAGQRRFSDGTAEAWAERVEALASSVRSSGSGSAENAPGGAPPRSATGSAGRAGTAPGDAPPRSATGSAGRAGTAPRHEGAAARSATGSAGRAGTALGHEGTAPGSATGSAGPVPRIGAAIHSVRAVAPEEAALVAEWARGREVPLHAHVSEQPAENEACLAAYGRTPTAVLAEAGALSERFTAIHVTHPTDRDRALLGEAGATCCLCPTTERDLADGIGPASRLRADGLRLAVGSDSQASIDLFEECRAIELDERLATLERGNLGAAELALAATESGHRAIGRPEAGRIERGRLADLVNLDGSGVRLAGIGPESALASIVFVATAADVTNVIVGGRFLVRDGRHATLDVAAELREAIATLGGTR